MGCWSQSSCILTSLTPSKNPGHHDQDELSELATLFTILSHTVGRIKCILCCFTGRGDLEMCSWFLLNFSQVHFPFADFNLYHFTVINHN